MTLKTKASQIAKASRDRYLRLSRRYAFVTFTLSLIFIACTNTSKFKQSSVTHSPTDTTVLKIWWDKGFTVDEDEAIQQLVSNWETQTGNKVKLSLYTGEELPQKVRRAIQAGNPPDIMMSYSAERALNPHLAWEGKLADITDVIEPVKNLYPEYALQSVNYYNHAAKKRSYYAVPINQSTVHIFYWRGLLKQIGRTESDIPKDWDGFWEFWKQVQKDLRAKNQKQNIYGLGFPFSTGASDTYIFFEHILEAYDVQILDSKGKLLIDDPKVRQKIVRALDWYAKFYQQGYTPPDALNWFNPDNNRSLLNRMVVMTPNNTLSIACSIRQDRDTYRHKLGILNFPNKPNGKPMRYLLTLRQAVLFADSQQQKKALDFLAYLVRSPVIGKYLKAAGGCNLPVMKPLWQDPFWKDPTDPHVSTAVKTITQGSTRLFPYVQNPAYSVVLEENIWGKALHRIIVDKISPEQATDEAIKQIKQIFSQW
ncbi:MAG: ABC transporter substrate-binding protein [Nostoc sp. ChiSLP02]|nr:ABC transporter substrate-binding protein [Nostoc sp. DedSLP05]MDZ8097621.1 ABC transporter substrate-binding protein [Nostoc sp. DedSLP01]MDZ8186758.1 ABC transporter substrate-binding protein [Nostoc sp. ChiSLP02]